MAQENGNGEAGESENLRWEGYSTYAEIAGQIAAIINDAVDAYAMVDSRVTENAELQAHEAAEARQKILRAAITLLPELRRDEASGEEVDDIVARWTGSGDDDGYIEKLQQTAIRERVPGWLFQFVIDIRTAGWELGYLKAGRTVKDEGEPTAEKEVKSMFE